MSQDADVGVALTLLDCTAHHGTTLGILRYICSRFVTLWIPSDDAIYLNIRHARDHLGDIDFGERTRAHQISVAVLSCMKPSSITSSGRCGLSRADPTLCQARAADPCRTTLA